MQHTDTERSRGLVDPATSRHVRTGKPDKLPLGPQTAEKSKHPDTIRESLPVCSFPCNSQIRDESGPWPSLLCLPGAAHSPPGTRRSTYL